MKIKQISIYKALRMATWHRVSALQHVLNKQKCHLIFNNHHICAQFSAQCKGTEKKDNLKGREDKILPHALCLKNKVWEHER